jgi:hypothetical protein
MFDISDEEGQLVIDFGEQKVPLSYYRLSSATSMLNVIFARNPEDSTAHEIIAHVYWGLAEDYIENVRDIQQRSVFSFNDHEIRAVEMYFELAQRHSVRAAQFAYNEEKCEAEDGDEIEVDNALYAKITREFAAFLVNAGKATEGLQNIEDLIQQGIELDETRIFCAQQFLPFAIEWIRRCENYEEELINDPDDEEYRSLLQEAREFFIMLRKVGINYLEDVLFDIQKRTTGGEYTDEDKRHLIQAYYYLGVFEARTNHNEQAAKYYLDSIVRTECDLVEFKAYVQQLQEHIAELTRWRVNKE